MANWKHDIDVSGFYHNDTLPPRRKGQLLAAKLRQKVLPSYASDNELKDIIEEFDDLPEIGLVVDGEAMIKSEVEEEFNGIMEDLYNWADTDHRLWIKTQ